MWEPPGSPHWRILNGRGEPMPVPNEVRVSTTDFPNGLEKALFPKFKELAPSEFYEVECNAQGYPTIIRWAWGSTMIFMSHDQDPMKFESGTFHAFHHDEPPPRNIRIAGFRGLMRHAGLEFFTSTPIIGGYLLRDVYKKADGHRIAVFQASIEENTRKAGGVLDEGTVELFGDMLTQEEKLARLHGRFPGEFGKCIPAYDDEFPQVVPKFKLDPKEWFGVSILDPGERKPDCVVWVAVHKTEPRAVVYDEVMGYETIGSCSKTAACVRRMEMDAGLIASHRLIDPRAAAANVKSSGKTYRQEYAENGLSCQPAPGLRIEAGFKRINEWLSYDRTSPGAVPYLQVMDHCSETRAELFNLTWKMKGTEFAARDKPDGKDDHVACLRYFAMWSPLIGQGMAEEQVQQERDQYDGLLDELYSGSSGGAHTGY